MTPRELGKPRKTRTRKIGLPPGSLVYIGEKQADGAPKTRITVMEYDGDTIKEREVGDPSELLPLDPNKTTWINVDAVHDEALLARFGELFTLHPLLLEDILNTEQRPKCEFMEEHVYVFLKMFDFSPDSQRILTEQVSIVLGRNYLISFQEEVGNEFDPIRERLRSNSTKLRKGGADALAYSLVDTIVDRYFLVLEKIGQCLGDMEETVTLHPDPEMLGQIHHIRRELIFLRKHVWPAREVVGNLQRADTDLIDAQTQTYLRDVYDHTVQVMDTLETYRDLLGGIQDLYLSILSNRMNEIMKVLTVISTIFIPLTFIVGVYGMNFKYMPELDWHLGYPLIWMIMLAIALGLLKYFKHKKWI